MCLSSDMGLLLSCGTGGLRGPRHRMYRGVVPGRVTAEKPRAQPTCLFPGGRVWMLPNPLQALRWFGGGLPPTHAGEPLQCDCSTRRASLPPFHPSIVMFVPSSDLYVSKKFSASASQ